MRCGIEVERATIVLLRVSDASTSTSIRLAGPSRATHEDEVVGILADNRNHSVSMGLHRTHIAGRFVPDFENHVVSLAEFLGGPSKEFLRFVGIARRAFNVPVKDDVNVVFDSGADHLRDHGLLVVFTTRRIGTTMAVKLFISNTESEAEHFDSHVLHHEAHSLGCIVNKGAICSRAPEKAHALDLHGLVLVRRAGTRQLATIGHQLTVRAHRTYTAGNHSHSSRYGRQRYYC